MEYDMRTDKYLIEWDKRMEDKFPVIPKVLPTEFMTLDDVVKMFPHCWVLLGEVKFTENMGLIGGVVKSVSRYYDKEVAHFQLYNSNNYVYEYTSEGDGRSIDCSGFRY